MYYVAYGSNLNSKEFKNRCPHSKVIGISYLKNRQLSFKGLKDNMSYLTIEEGHNNVPVVIYEIDSNDLQRLDDYEGYPNLYYRKSINIKVNNKDTRAIIYIMDDHYQKHIPSSTYVAEVIKGYNDFDLPVDDIITLLIDQLTKDDHKKTYKKRLII